MEYIFDLPSFMARRKPKDRFEFNVGYGLQKTFNNIFLCRGKFMIQTGRVLAAFLDPIQRGNKPKVIRRLYPKLLGTHYCIGIPLAEENCGAIPTTVEGFLAWK